jgi:PAS domain S-box-containing protein
VEERKSRTASARQRAAPVPSPARPPKKTRRPIAAPEGGGTRERRLFDRAPVGLYRATPAGKIVGVNSTFLEMSGYPDPGALAAVNAADLFADPVARMRLRAVLEGQGVVEFESRLRRMDGTLVPVRAYMQAVREGSGRVEWIEGAIIDVTAHTPARDAMQESAERLRLIARATRDLLWDWDLLTNEGWRSAGDEPGFGYGGDLDRPWPDWWSEKIHPEDREKVLIGVRAAINEGADSWTSEYRFRRSDGEYARVRDHGYIIRDARRRAVRMVGAMTDLTDRSAAEEEMRRRAAYLEALNAVIAGAAAAPDLRALLEGAIDRTMSALAVPLGAIWVGDLHIDRGISPEAARVFADAREAAAPDRAGAMIASDWPEASAPPAESLAPLQALWGIWAFLNAPVEKDGRIVGGLAVASPELRVWRAEEKTLAATVGTQVGAAVERLHLFAEAQRRAR